VPPPYGGGMHEAELHLPAQITIAGGCSDDLGSVATRLGMRRPLIVTDPFMAEHGPAGRFAEALGAPLFPGVQADPTTANVADGLAALREHDADGVIAVGGGSSLDTGKAVAVMARNDGAIGDYAGYGRIPRAGLPLIGVPTTAGTGSEVTRVTVITDSEQHVKMMLLDDHLLCDAALVDFELTLSCPRDLTAFVGVDSLTHAIESYVSAKASPVTDDWALRAAALIGAHLRRAWNDPEDREARAALALGATLAGMAFSNASVALVHGMSRPIGAHFGVPHGLSNAVLLPEVTRWSLDGAPERYARIAEVLGAGDLVDTLQQLNDDLGIPRLATLAERDAFDAATAEMAEAALDSGSPAFNPRVPDAGEIVALYERAYSA
jgi:alcohol dehydrogenase class IV